MENSTVVEAIRYLMDTHGISAAELSKGTGIATSTMYSMLEKKSNVVILTILSKSRNNFTLTSIFLQESRSISHLWNWMTTNG